MVGCAGGLFARPDVSRSNTTNLVEILSINYEEKKKLSLNFLCFCKNDTEYIFCNMKKHNLKKYGPAKDQSEVK
jgi:hypothetical protein